MHNKHILQTFVLIVCCLGTACSKTPAAPRNLTVDSTAVAYYTSTVDLYRLAGYDATVHKSMTILDADEENILFALESKRESSPHALGEGILVQTTSVGLLNQQSGEVTQIALPSASVPSYVYQGTIVGDNLWFISIALSGDDNQYSVTNSNGNVVHTIRTGTTERHFLQWPQIIRLGDDVFLIEMGTEPQFGRLTQDGLQRVNLTPPDGARLASNQYASDGNRVVTLWAQGDKTLFIINNSDKLLATVELPYDDGIVNFALTQDGFVASVKSRTTEKSYLRFTDLTDSQTDYYPCIEIYRMNGRFQQGQLMGLSSSFTPYLFTFDASGAIQSEIDMSEWCENGRIGRVTVISADKNVYLLNLHDQQHVVRIEVSN